jgi:hypothetical protein
VFSVAIAMSVAAAVISLMRGGQFYFDAPETPGTPGAAVAPDPRVGPVAAPVPAVAEGPQADGVP